VRCDHFEVSYYPDPVSGRPSDRPKDYKSWLSVLENGKTILQKTIEVNDPLIYKGIYFYQSSYGQRGGKAAFLSVYGPRRNLLANRAKLAKGDALELEGGARLRLLDLTADYRGTGPAVLIALEKEGAPRSEPVVVQESGGAPIAVSDFLMRLDGVESAMYTGLQVAKDPGVPIIWAGCILITVGLLVAFFVSHRRVWARVTPGVRGSEILIAGNASRNRMAFEKWFGEFAQHAEETFEK
jgi:cytochrome c biogenesis protein